jgi:hypothetical protein
MSMKTELHELVDIQLWLNNCPDLVRKDQHEERDDQSNEQLSDLTSIPGDDCIVTKKSFAIE